MTQVAGEPRSLLAKCMTRSLYTEDNVKQWLIWSLSNNNERLRTSYYFIQANYWPTQSKATCFINRRLWVRSVAYLLPAYLGSHWERAVKRVCCCYCCVCVPYFVNMLITFHTITLKFILKYLRKEISIHSCYLCLKDRIKLSLIPEKYHVDATLPANSTNTLHSRLQNRSHRFDWFSFHGTFLTFHLKNTIYGTKQ